MNPGNSFRKFNETANQVDNSKNNFMGNELSMNSKIPSSDILENNNDPKKYDNKTEGKEKIGQGKEIDENGNIKDSSTKKLTKAVGQGAAAYFTGGASLGADQKVMNNSHVDNAIGTVSDKLEKTPGVKEVAEGLDEAGVIDTATDAMNLAGDIKNKDVGSAIEHGKDLAKDSKKIKKQINKKMLPIILSSVGTLLFLIIFIVVILGPVIGGFIDMTEDKEGNGNGTYTSEEADSDLTAINPDYNNLSADSQSILAAAASLLGRPYKWGGHPSGPGLSGFPSTGLDCGGYVQWVLWTATGQNPGYLTTDNIYDLIGKKFVRVDESNLQPGDIGLKKAGHSGSNHTGIYAGNGSWMHAAGKKQGIVNSKYKGFTIYLRYVG